MNKKLKQEPQDQMAGTAEVIDVTLRDPQTDSENGEHEKTIAETEEEAQRLKESQGASSYFHLL